jgi:hypothetical protein
MRCSADVQLQIPKLSQMPPVGRCVRQGDFTVKALGLMTAVSIALTTWAGGAAADPWKDESGHGRWISRDEHREDYRPRRYYRERYSYKRYSYKEEFRRGRCKIERKWDDEYKEEIKCKRGWRRPVYDYYGGY